MEHFIPKISIQIFINIVLDILTQSNLDDDNTCKPIGYSNHVVNKRLYP